MHLKNDLVLPGKIATILANAGTSAELHILAREHAPDGGIRYAFDLSRFKLRTEAGELPVAPVQGKIEHLTAGTEIPATTQGNVALDQTGRIRVTIPLPFILSNDTPQGGYTPIPIKTPRPFTHERGERGRRSSPPPVAAPSTEPSTAPTTAASPEPQPNASA